MNHVRLRTVALGVLMALAALALTASSASALPEFGQCFVQAKHEGRYTDNVCTKKAKKVSEKFTGEFEWRKATEIEAAKKKFSGTGGAVHLYTLYRVCESFSVRKQACNPGEEESIIPLNVECTSETNQGEISGTNAVKNVQVAFKGCLDSQTGSPCQSGPTPEEIKLNALKGKLGFIDKKPMPRQAGLVIEAAKAKAKIATYECEGTGLSFNLGVGNEAEGCVYPQKLCGGDGVISAITPVNTATASFTQVFTASEETAENIPTKFEGKPLKLLEGYLFKPATTTTSMWSKVGESLTNSFKTPEAIELKAN
jgi:hypothetical protein